jgi:hypothetical protein
MMSLPVGDRSVGAAEVRGFPEAELLRADARLVDLDAETRPRGHRVDRAFEPGLDREDPGSQAKLGTAAAKWIVAAVQIGPSGLCGMRST